MLLEDLPIELLGHIFVSCSAISDVVNLASTCHRMRDVYLSSRRLTILVCAAEAEYGPLEDAVQVVTHNSSQPAHVMRSVPLSDALLKQVIRVGRVAQRWEELYSFKKWKDDFENRRLLSNMERRTLRRALYRLWLYTVAFHAPTYPRYSRLQAPVVHMRTQLLHNWSNAELAEIKDVQNIVREVLRFNVCPSNGTVQRKFRKRFPDTNHQLLFNVHLNYPPPPSAAMQQYYTHSEHHLQHHSFTNKYQPTKWHEPGVEGWGDDIQHYYVVEDMLKLDPAQILWLKENAPMKSHVERYVQGLGSWFDNNGETFNHTLEAVLVARGESMREFMADIEDCTAGVVKADEDNI